MAFSFVKQVVDEYLHDDCPMMAAGLAFYAVFSIPPLLFVMVSGAGALLGPSVAEQGLINQIGRLLGPFREPNDGTVAVAETAIAGVTDHIVLPVAHMALLWSTAVAAQTEHFLLHGRFNHVRLAG